MYSPTARTIMNAGYFTEEQKEVMREKEREERAQRAKLIRSIEESHAKLRVMRWTALNKMFKGHFGNETVITPNVFAAQNSQIIADQSTNPRVSAMWTNIVKFIPERYIYMRQQLVFQVNMYNRCSNSRPLYVKHWMTGENVMVIRVAVAMTCPDLITRITEDPERLNFWSENRGFHVVITHIDEMTQREALATVFEVGHEDSNKYKICGGVLTGYTFLGRYNGMKYDRNTTFDGSRYRTSDQFLNLVKGEMTKQLKAYNTFYALNVKFKQYFGNEKHISTENVTGTDKADNRAIFDELDKQKQKDHNMSLEKYGAFDVCIYKPTDDNPLSIDIETKRFILKNTIIKRNVSAVATVKQYPTYDASKNDNTIFYVLFCYVDPAKNIKELVCTRIDVTDKLQYEINSGHFKSWSTQSGPSGGGSRRRKATVAAVAVAPSKKSWKVTDKTHACKDGVKRKVYTDGQGVRAVKCKVVDRFVYKKI